MQTLSLKLSRCYQFEEEHFSHAQGHLQSHFVVYSGSILSPVWVY